jgi:hypothetical protein
MNNTHSPKEHIELIIKRFAETLPECFKLHAKLLAIADSESHEINGSLNDLGKALGYDCYALFYFLNSLAGLKFIQFPSPIDCHQKIKIKIIVFY